ncbi:MAG: hypothetical protein ACK56A_05220 [Bacteroidota bacterium]
MVNKLRPFLLLLACTFYSWSTFAQKDIKDALEEYLMARQPEKAYVQSNQYHYSVGERIFYKVYLVAGDSLSAYTRNVYAEWYDQDGKYIQRQVLPAAMGLTAGDFLIPDKYIGQRIYLKLFTAFMQQPTSVPFLVTSFVVDQPGQMLMAPDTGTEGVQVMVHPEGGVWVKGISSVLTIRTKNGNDLPIGMNCRIIDENGQMVNLVSTAPLGYAQVEVTPESTGPYYIQVELPNGIWAQQALPAIQAQGVAFRFDPLDFSFILQRTPDAPPSQQKVTFLVMHQNKLVLETSFSLEQKTRLKGRFSIDSFSTGFHRLIWLDDQQQILGQRVIYLHRPKSESILLNTDTISFDKKGQNVFTLQSLDTLFSSLSVAITDAGYEEINPDNSVYQLMGSDIFLTYPTQTNQAIRWLTDNQFRLFDQWLQAQRIWYPAMNDLLTDTIASAFPRAETGYIHIRGKVDNLSEKKTKKAGSMNLIISTGDNEKELVQAELEEDGSFYLDDLFYYDSVSVYLQPNGITVTDENKMALQNNLIASNPTRRLSVPRLQLLPSADSLAQVQQKYAADKRILDSMAASGTLQEVVVTTRVKKRIEEIDEKYTTGVFSSDGVKFDIVSDNFAIAQPNVFSYLQGRVAGLQISTQTYGAPSLRWRGDPVAVFLNEVQLTDPSALNNIPMSDVAYIKVFRPPFFGAYLGGSGGAIAVYTRRGDEGGMYDVTGLKRIKLEGYSRPTNWENNLTDPDNKKKPVRDIRKTLYWSPSIQLDKDVNTYTIRFKNNDVTTRFRFIAEGVNKAGKLIRLEKIIQQP